MQRNTSGPRSSGRFWLALHRAGNTLRGVEQVAALAEALALEDHGIALAPEIDLKWLCMGDEVRLYGYHGPQVPGCRFDLLQRPDVLARRVEVDAVLSLDGLFRRFSRLHFVLELKAGVGPVEAALDALGEQIQAAGAAERVMLLSNDLPRAVVAKQRLPWLPLGTMHAWATARGSFIR